MLDSKPAITLFYVYFYVIPFFSPLHVGTRTSLRHVVCHHLYLKTLRSVKVVTDDASLRHEFRVSTERCQIQNPSLRHFTGIFTSYLSPPRCTEEHDACLTEARRLSPPLLRNPRGAWRWWQKMPHWGSSSEFQRGENRLKPAITSFCIHFTA